MLRQQKVNQIPIALAILACLSLLILFSCSPQDKETTESTTEQTDTEKVAEPETVIKPAEDSEKTETAAKPMIDAANAIAVISTAKGDIEFEFYASDAPNASKNFIKNASEGYYRNEKFHRVEELVIQAGSSLINETQPIEKSDHPLEKGVVLMVTEDGSTVADGDEFLICKDAIVNDGWTILGKVTKGLEVLDSIAKDDKILNITIRERNEE